MNAARQVGDLPHIAPVVWILLACAAFTLLGAMLIPYAGLQNDEVAFVTPLYYARPELSLHLGRHRLPLMIQSYAGTLKTLLYRPILRRLPPGPFPIRLPMVLAGAVTIFLFYRFAEALAGRPAAVIAAMLLASDATFLLTNTFDWGPVALQHLLLMAGCLAIARRRPAWGCFFFGLALWDKAVVGWTLAGLAAGVLAAYVPEVRRFAVDRKIVVRSVAAFLLGALPFLVYNVSRPNATLKTNAHVSLDDLPGKFAQVRYAAEGSALFGYLVAENPDQPKQPSSFLGRAAAWFPEHAGTHRTSLFPYALVFAVLAAPLWWRLPGSRAALFSLVFCVVAFLAMALTKGGGGAAHHAVLLWPFPHLLAGVALAAIRPRWLSLALSAVLVASNLLVIDQYLFRLERDGAAGPFTDALNPLSNSLSDAAHDTIYVIDWGMFDNLQYLHRGRLSLRPASDPLISPAPDENQRGEIAEMLRDPRGLFLGHGADAEAFSGVGEHLKTAAQAAGYERVQFRVVADSNGRPIFELYRFRATAKSPSRSP